MTDETVLSHKVAEVALEAAFKPFTSNHSSLSTNHRLQQKEFEDMKQVPCPELGDYPAAFTCLCWCLFNDISNNIIVHNVPATHTKLMILLTLARASN